MNTDNTDGSDNTENPLFEKDLGNRNQFIYKDESFAIRGAIFEVYNQMGSGFLESVYQECLIREFTLRNVPFVSQPRLEIQYKGELISSSFQPDFVCFHKIIVEIKTVRELTDEFRSQILNYMKASSFRLGLLVNFGSPYRATIERFVR